MKRRWVVSLVIVAAMLAMVFLVPTWRAIVIGICRSERTFRGKPTSYWALALTERDEGAAAATVALLRKGGTQAVPVLIEALTNEDAQVRLNAALALGTIGKDAVPWLLDALTDPIPIVRIGAARALNRVGPDGVEAIPCLHKALEDDEPLVVKLSLTALGHTNTDAVPILVEFFQKSKDINQRMIALESLAALGPSAKAAVAVLIKAAREEDDPINEKAAEALKKVDAEAAAKNGFE